MESSKWTHANWPHQWFGVWKEMGTAYRYCPSILDFVGTSYSSELNLQIVRYLSEAPSYMLSTRGPCIFSGSLCHELKGESGAITIRSDGEWIWWDDLAHYVNHHNVLIPDRMLQHLESRGFHLPERLSQDQFTKFSMPEMYNRLEIPRVDGRWIISTAHPDTEVALLDAAEHRRLVEICRREANQFYASGNMLMALARYGCIAKELDADERERKSIAEKAFSEMIKNDPSMFRQT